MGARIVHWPLLRDGRENQREPTLCHTLEFQLPPCGCLEGSGDLQTPLDYYQALSLRYLPM